MHELEHFFADHVDAIAGAAIISLAVLVVLGLYNLSARIVAPRVRGWLAQR